MVQVKNAVAEKTATKPTQKNGATPETPEIKTALSAELPAIEPEKRVPLKLFSIEERLQLLAEMQELADSRDLIYTAVQNLSNFYISPDGTGCLLKLQDSKNKTFTVHNPAVITEMVAMAKEKLTAEMLRIENLIDFSI